MQTTDTCLHYKLTYEPNQLRWANKSHLLPIDIVKKEYLVIILRWVFLFLHKNI